MAEKEAKIHIYPLSRAAFPGSESKFEVEVEGAQETTLEIKPCNKASGYEIAVNGAGVGTSFVTIKAPQVAENACLDFTVEAKDEAGKIVATEHAEIVIGQKAVPLTLGVTTVIGVGLVTLGIVFSAPVVSEVLIGLGVGVALAAGIASLFGIYGKNIGYPFHFTKAK